MEIEEAERLTQLLGNHGLTEENDELAWREDQNVFTVKHCYSLIAAARMAVGNSALEGLRKYKVWPARENFFIWLMFRGKVLTDDRMKAMGNSIVSKCSLCGEEETSDHLFLHCRTTRDAYSALTWGSDTRMSNIQSIEDHINRWTCNNLTSTGQKYWVLLPHAFFWTIWLARNECRFEEQKMQSWRLIQKIKHQLWSWGLDCKELEKVRVEQLMFSWKQLVFK